MCVERQNQPKLSNRIQQAFPRNKITYFVMKCVLKIFFKTGKNGDWKQDF